MRWRQEMAGNKQVIFLALLSCTILLIFGGCSHFSKLTAAGKDVDAEQTQAERDKARLLKKVNRDYEDPQAHFELGRLYQQEGQWVRAEREYNIALNFDPVHRQAQAARVKALLGEGDEAKSQMLAEIYSEQASTSAAGSLSLALAFQSQGLDEYALNCYQQALRLAPNSAKVNRQIGYYYLSKNELVRAQEYLSRSFQLNPNQPDVAGQLGRLGVAVRIPSDTKADVKLLDKTIDNYDEQLQQ